MSYIFYYSMPKNYHDVYEMLDWVKKNCPSYITNDAMRTPETLEYKYRFYFGKEDDLMLCILRWS